MRVSVGDAHEERNYTLVDLQQEHTAMQRTTGYSIAIIAQMIGQGRITQRGALRQETSIPPQLFIEEWAKRGIDLQSRSIEK